MYPNMKFRESGLRNSEKICFGKFYQSSVLNPKRYNRAYELERTSVSRAAVLRRRSNASQMESLRTTGNFWECARCPTTRGGVSFWALYVAAAASGVVVLEPLACLDDGVGGPARRGPGVASTASGVGPVAPPWCRRPPRRVSPYQFTGASPAR